MDKNKNKNITNSAIFWAMAKAVVCFVNEESLVFEYKIEVSLNIEMPQLPSDVSYG